MVNQEFAGKFLPIIDGARPTYGGFDFRVSNVNSEGVDLVAGCKEAVGWLPSIKAGIQDYCQAIQDEGERFDGIKIEITKIYSHDPDTTDEAMRYRGWMFLRELTRLKGLGSKLQAIEE